MAAKVARDQDAPLGRELWLHWHADKIVFALLCLIVTVGIILSILSAGSSLRMNDNTGASSSGNAAIVPDPLTHNPPGATPY